MFLLLQTMSVSIQFFPVAWRDGRSTRTAGLGPVRPGLRPQTAQALPRSFLSREGVRRRGPSCQRQEAHEADECCLVTIKFQQLLILQITK